MVRRAPGASDARVYDVSTRTLAPLQASLNVGLKSETAQKRARRKLELQNTDTDLIQDFEFPTVSHRVKVSPDGRYIFASGTYPPQLHVYDTEQLSLKFKRHVDSEIVDFQILDEDWRKFVILSTDRYVDFHSPFGSHYKTRVPSCGRDLMIHRGTADLFVCGQGAEVWRFNMDQGRFLAPLTTRSGAQSGNNVCGISPVNSLLAFGGDTGLLDMYDPRIIGRNQRPIASLDIASILANQPDTTSISKALELTVVRFNDYDGVSLAVGTSSGHSLLFDLRSSQPVLTRDQGNGLPLRSFRFHDDRLHCVSADVKSVKVWDKRGGANKAVVEPEADVNHLCVVGASGVMCAAVEAPRVKSFYIPALGAAPKWCSFLDTFTEELEGGRDVRAVANMHGGDDGNANEDNTVYENYKFVTSDELETLGLTHLVGTDMLKAYMHGYFMHQKLHQRAIQVTEPFAYDKYRKQKARERIESLRESRITKVRGMGKKKQAKVKVNQNTVDNLRERQKSGKAGADTGMSLLEDDRFTAMFSNKDYAVDEEAERFQFLHPKVSNRRQEKKQEEEEASDEEYLERFELVDDGTGEGPKQMAPEGDNLWSSDDENNGDENDEDGDDGEDNDEAITTVVRKEKEKLKDKERRGKKDVKPNGKAKKMYEIEKESDVLGKAGLSLNGVVGSSVSRQVREKVSLGDRLKSNMSSTGASRNGEVVSNRRRRGR